MAFKTILTENKSGDQIIKIPKEYRIKDDKVYIKKFGNSLFIIPFNNPWQSMINSLNEFSEDFMTDRKQPDTQTRESIDK